MQISSESRVVSLCFVSLCRFALAKRQKQLPMRTDVQHAAEFTVFGPINLCFTSGLLADGRNCFKLKLNHSIDSSQTSHHCSHGPFINTVQTCVMNYQTEPMQASIRRDFSCFLRENFYLNTVKNTV